MSTEEPIKTWNIRVNGHDLQVRARTRSDAIAYIRGTLGSSFVVWSTLKPDLKAVAE